MDEAAKTKDSLLSWAWKAFKSGNPRGAIQKLEFYLGEIPDDKDAATLLGRIYLKTGQPQQGSVWLEHALKISDRRKAEKQHSSQDYASEEAITAQDFQIYAEAHTDQPSQHEIDFASSLPDGDQVEYAPIPPSHPQHDEKSNLDEEPAGVSADIPEESQFHEDVDDLLDWIQEPEKEHFSTWEDWLAVEDETAEEELQDPGGETSAGLTYEDRAKQEAARLAAEVGWDRSELQPLIEILTQHRCHAKTIGAIRALLMEEHATPAELDLLVELRGIWATYGFNRVYWGDQTKDGWQNLSWQMGLMLVRTLNCQYSDEALLFLTNTFEEWSYDTNLITIFPNFKHYVFHILNGVDQGSPWWIQRMDNHDNQGHYASSASSEMINIPAYQLLEDYGLLENQGGIQSPLEG